MIKQKQNILEMKINKNKKRQLTPISTEQRDNLFKKFNDKNKKNYIHIMQKIVEQERMKQIVSENVKYFRNIIQIKQNCKPNQLTLKFRTRVPKTLYTSDFAKKLRFDSPNFSPQIMSQKIKIKQNTKKIPFTKTIYQNQFKKLGANPFIQRIKNLNDSIKRRNQYEEENSKNQAPLFLNTHNNIQFPNWGIGKNLPNMKPFEQVATTTLQFKASTIYKNDFYTHSLPKTQMIVYSQNSPKKPNIWTGNSSYRKDFQEKKNRKCDILFKPQENCAATMLKFNNSTQYKVEFEQNKILKEEMKKKSKKLNRLLTNDQIQNLVMKI